MKRVIRCGDMAPDRALVVSEQADGDIVVSIGMFPSGMPLGVAGDENGATVEFCSLAGGGGRSSHTRRALVALMQAMEFDNCERPIKSIGGGDDR